MLDDDRLFAGVRARDPAAWEEFVERFGPVVHAAARRAGLRRDEVEDAVQSTWSTLLRHAATIREPRSLPAWVVTTATRAAWRIGRRQGLERQARSDREAALELPNSAPGADREAEQLERVQIVRDELQRLDGRCGELLRGLFLDPGEPSYEELSARLGLAIGSIGPTRQRCLARLAAALERRGFSAGGPLSEPNSDREHS
jgi:RNA polymerase sigma factor (sigma-70 family)